MTVLLNSSASSEIGLGVQELSRGFLVAFIVILPTYLIAAKYGFPAGKASVSETVGRKLWPLFWIVVVLLGLVLPIGVVIYSLVVGLEKTPFILLYLSIAFELLGDLFLRYLILKNGFYNPLVPAPAYYTSGKNAGTS